jgi:hypothetical protein
MARWTLFMAVVALTTFAAPIGARAQTTDSIPAAMAAKRLPRQKLSGPRFGFTTFTGDVADMRDQAGRENIMTQFGWQWETQIVSVRGGNQALMEWVLLVGGVEQDEFNISLGWITGYRLANGVEIGVGPNFSTNKDNRRITTSMVVAGGSTLPFGDMYVPVNLAVAMAKGGPRITVLTGWIIG